MYLGLRTDSPVAEFYLYEGATERATQHWQADRELARGILRKLEEFLAENDVTFTELSGLFVFQGPGSFTGLRIGLSVANTMSYSLSIPIVSSLGDNWVIEGVTQLQNGQNDNVVLPEYGAPARITRPTK